MDFSSTYFLAGVVGFLAALTISVILVCTKHLHGKLTLDTDEGIQKFHKAPTPRVGGLSLALGYFAVWFFLEGEARNIFGLIGLAGIPAMAFGLAEDLSKLVGVRARLLATIASGMGFIVLTGYTVDHVDVYGIDAVLTMPLFAFAFTAFAIGGVANSINIIDGFHGLASGTLIILLLAFALVGWRVGDTVFMQLALLMVAIMAGFFVVNFPFGKLFLGDGGAYFAGYLVSVLAVMLPARNPEVSPWVSLLILGYPVTETIVSMVRRLRNVDAHPGEPDSAHLHHIVHRNLARRASRFVKLPAFENPITSLIMWGLPLVTLLSVWVSGMYSVSALWFVVLIVLLYVAVYCAIVAHENNMKKN